MPAATLIIDGVLLLGMIGVSLYGAARLPDGAQVPIHFGPGSYNNWVSKNIGLVLWPAAGMVVYVILIITHRSGQASGRSGSGLAVGLTVALVVMLVTQVGALRVAFSRSGRD